MFFVKFTSFSLAWTCLLALVAGCALHGLTDQALAQTQPPKDAHMNLKLWYKSPGKEPLTEGLALGNGRIGALVLGNPAEDIWVLNEDTVWSGQPYDPSTPGAWQHMKEVRELVFAEKWLDAAKIIDKHMQARPGQRSSQIMSKLHLSFPGHNAASDYQRSLDLDTATAAVTYKVNGVTFKREAFASAADQVIVARFTADKPGSLTMTVGLSTPQAEAKSTADGKGLIVLTSRNTEWGHPSGLRLETRAQIKRTGGTMTAEAGNVTITGADEVVVTLAMATSFKNWRDASANPDATNKATLEAVKNKTWQQLYEAHLANHQAMFRRVKMDLGTSDAVKLPTDERIKNYANGNDPAFAALYFQFGRYLLMGSSRPGDQPAHLQGIWNDSLNPPWGGKYTININIQMNYWLAEPGNLSECGEPMTRMVTELSDAGRQTARNLWNAPGWVTHHNTDLWRATMPIDGPFYGFWPMGGAWLAQQLWEHYEYTGDQAYLQQIYPIFREACEFFLATLVEEPKHKWLVTCPSMSPEHGHHRVKNAEGKDQAVSLCAGPTMDVGILRDLFSHTLEGAEKLGVDDNLRQRLADAMKRLPPYQIGAQGQLQEWLEDWDKNADDFHHRHISHLYALHPSDQISPLTTPALAKACRETLEQRRDNSTGWSLAWKINCWARLRDAERTHKVLGLLLTPERTYPNMFDAHPPFQIDGNFGGATGILEMLLQSRPGEIDVLPALPKAWPTGSVTGLCAKGGFEVDIAWEHGKLKTLKLRSKLGQETKVLYAGKTVTVKPKAGEELTLGPALNR